MFMLCYIRIKVYMVCLTYIISILTCIYILSTPLCLILQLLLIETYYLNSINSGYLCIRNMQRPTGFQNVTFWITYRTPGTSLAPVAPSKSLKTLLYFYGTVGKGRNET